MALITTDLDGSATVLLASGTAARLPGLDPAREATGQDIQNLARALFALVKDLDDRLESLEKK